MITYEQAIKIAKQFANNVKTILKDKLLAVFAIGSLGSDYYRPGQSDIDTIIITSLKREDLKIYRKDIRKLADSYQKKYDVPKGFGAILLAKEQLYPPYKYDEELILEIYRIKKQSKLVYGHYDIRTIPFPSKKDIIQDAIAFENWTVYDEAKLVKNTFDIAVQVNGKLRGTITVNIDDSEDVIKEKALSNENVKRHTEGKEIVKVIVIKNKIVNIVVKG